ncbi:MAG: hypothetical protein AAFY12_11955 [Pseudomonadota bacterium]
MNTFMSDFAGRRLTASAIFVAAVGSASLNVWGASQIFPNPATALIFAIVITACEVIAFLSLRHIVRDFGNFHYWKAALGTVIFVFSIAGCVISGKQAFHVLFLEANANHKALEIRYEARQNEADQYHADMLAGKISDISPQTAQARWERKQDAADDAHIAKLKAKPPHIAIVFVLLALFEMVKIGGLYSLASPTEKGRSWAQRRADKRRAEINDAKAKAAHAEKLAYINDAA